MTLAHSPIVAVSSMQSIMNAFFFITLNKSCFKAWLTLHFFSLCMMCSQTTSSTFISILNSINKKVVYYFPASANKENNYDSWILNVKMEKKNEYLLKCYSCTAGLKQRLIHWTDVYWVPGYTALTKLIMTFVLRKLMG